MHRSHVRILLSLLLAAHLLLGVGRIPHAVFGKRNAEAALYERLGRSRYLLDTKHHQGFEAVEWLIRNTPEDAIVLWRGESRGSLELVPDLLFPRLLYEASRVPSAARSVHGRPVASKVLVGLGDDLELVPR